MTPLEAAKAHLRKAEEFLQAAEMSLDREQFNAATSSAVTSGINSKDAVCLTLTGSSAKSENHATAVKELKAAGPDAARLVPAFTRLLKPKTKAQYQAESVARSEAVSSLRNARQMLEGAQ